MRPFGAHIAAGVPTRIHREKARLSVDALRILRTAVGSYSSN
jgi:hypothetical protein